MSEIWRVLKLDGQAFFATQAIAFPEASEDPQHVNIITQNSLLYLSAPHYIQLSLAYGFKGKFEVIQHVWANKPVKVCENSFCRVVPYHLIWHLQAIK